MSGSALVKCDCTHEYQDKQYGKGVRVANITAKGASRCTVCGKTSEPRYAVAGKPDKKAKK